MVVVVVVGGINVADYSSGGSHTLTYILGAWGAAVVSNNIHNLDSTEEKRVFI